MLDYSLLTRVFSRSVLKCLLEKRKSYAFDAAINEFVSKPSLLTYADNFNYLYKVMHKEYRNEYYYKNTLLNRLLLEIHSTKTTTALTELPIANAKADFVLINGKAVVYEIKTELDNFNRLENQIKNYYKVFDHVSVVTCEANKDNLLEMYADTPVGLYVITSRGKFSEVVKPKKNQDNLDYTDMFLILRKNEFEQIIYSYYGYLPSVSQYAYYDVCQEMFVDIEHDFLYKAFLVELKKRGKESNEQFDLTPKSLKFLCYFCGFNNTQYKRLNSLLLTRYGGE